MPILKYALPCAICLALAGTASAAGTQRILSHAGTCEMSVPANWKVGKWIKSSADSPDGTMSAVISTAKGSPALADVKPIVMGSFPPTKTFEDSAQRLWFAYGGNGHKRMVGWYVGVPGKAGVCGAQIAFSTPAQAALAKQIALSVKPAG